MTRPERVIAQVMNIGTPDDVQSLVDVVGEDVFRDVLVHAEAGQFSAQSWRDWHYRLGLTRVGETPVPPMPARRVE